MDGIFGIGPAEILIIVFVLLVVGGPRNTVKWAREAGKLIHQLRQMWSQMMRQLENEMGDEGKELMKTTRELTQGVNQIRGAANPTRLAAQATRYIEKIAEEPAKPTQNGAKTDESPTPEERDESTQYSAWLPKNK